MKKLDKTLIAEYLGLMLAVGVMLFVVLNTAEAKKLVNFLLAILNPFIYGFCIAFVLNLVTKLFDRGFEKHAIKKGKPYHPKKKRSLSIVLSLLVFLLFAGLTVGMIIPNLKNTVVSLYKQAPQLWEKFLGFLDTLKTKQPKLATYITSFENSLDNYYDKMVASLKSNLSDIASTAVTKIKSASGVLMNFALGLIIAFGILMKKEELKKEFTAILKKLLPATAYRRTRYVLDLANKKFQIYFKYNLIQAVITGAATFLVMLVSGMPYKVSISLLITVTQLIPIIGAIVGTVVSALLIAAVSPVKAIVFVILCVIVQQVVEKLINPHLMGKELEMPGDDIYTQKLRPRIYTKKER